MKKTARRLGVLLFLFCMVCVFSACGRARVVSSPSGSEASTTEKGEKLPTAHEPKVEQGAAQSEKVDVRFACPVLEQLVRAEIGKPSGAISSSDMLELWEIRANLERISSLQGLEHATNLMDISIQRNEVELDSLEPISQLTSLNRLNFSYMTIREIPSLKALTQLQYAVFIDAQLGHIEFMSGLTTVEHLTLSRNGIEDIEALRGMKELRQLNLSDNLISNIKPLRDSTKIQSLIIDKNQVSDITPLEGMKELTTLIVSYNPITNLKPLEDLPRLSDLTIYQHHDVKHHIFDQIDILAGKGVDVSYHR